MKNQIKLLAVACFAFATIPVYAQDSTGVIHGAIENISTHKTLIGVVVGVYEVLARWIPTVKNCSILSGDMRFVKFVLPNRQVNGAKFL